MDNDSLQLDDMKDRTETAGRARDLPWQLSWAPDLVKVKNSVTRLVIEIK